MNLPNALSLLRIAMVPVFAVVFFMDSPNAHRYAALIFALAYSTDALDGYIARKYNKITRLGRVLDPLADKLMTGTALTCITVAGIIPVWVIIIFLCKEAAMGIGSLALYKHIDDVIPSNMLGKVATVVFFVTCLALMLFDLPAPWPVVLIAFALALTICSLVVYAYKFLRLIRDKENKS